MLNNLMLQKATTASSNIHSKKRIGNSTTLLIMTQRTRAEKAFLLRPQHAHAQRKAERIVACNLNIHVCLSGCGEAEAAEMRSRHTIPPAEPKNKLWLARCTLALRGKSFRNPFDEGLWASAQFIYTIYKRPQTQCCCGVWGLKGAERRQPLFEKNEPQIHFSGHFALTAADGWNTEWRISFHGVVRETKSLRRLYDAWWLSSSSAPKEFPIMKNPFIFCIKKSSALLCTKRWYSCQITLLMGSVNVSSLIRDSHSVALRRCWRSKE